MMAADTGVDDAPVIEADEANDFAALTRMAGDDPNAQPGEGQGEAAPSLGLDKEIAGALQMLVGVVGPLFPSLKAIYTEETCGAVGAAVAPVCEKHGWLSGGIGGEYGEELMCLIVVGPLGYATYTAVQNDIEERRQKSKAQDGKAPNIASKAPAGALATPGSDTVTFGAPIQ